MRLHYRCHKERERRKESKNLVRRWWWCWWCAACLTMCAYLYVFGPKTHTIQIALPMNREVYHSGVAAWMRSPVSSIIMMRCGVFDCVCVCVCARAHVCVFVCRFWAAGCCWLLYINHLFLLYDGISQFQFFNGAPSVSSAAFAFLSNRKNKYKIVWTLEITWQLALNQFIDCFQLWIRILCVNVRGMRHRGDWIYEWFSYIFWMNRAFSSQNKQKQANIVKKWQFRAENIYGFFSIRFALHKIDGIVIYLCAKGRFYSATVCVRVCLWIKCNSLILWSFCLLLLCVKTADHSPSVYV